ncbi:hypothetical protein HME9304_03274 [Flagellimonas maritima]|uniref:Uncharacterized protein n=1 Tax=Flagellimonas maritima TaxID=1383885 RepID=A0A2Z4LWN9_9FLAO|nr:hypothetical protein HME9304_03274 [Allomuricauda aurantiaca]
MVIIKMTLLKKIYKDKWTDALLHLTNGHIGTTIE